MPTQRFSRQGLTIDRSKPLSEAAYFLSLELRNVRCFDLNGVKLDLSDGFGKPARWSILLGNNGSGKTTILQALSAFDPVFLIKNGMVDDSAALPRAMKWHMDGVTRNFIRDELDYAELVATLVSASEADDNNEQYTSLVKIAWAGLPVIDFKNYKKRPYCYGYGASRRLGNALLGERDARDGTASLLRDDATLLNAEEWLLRLDYSASKRSRIQEKQRARRDHVELLLLSILPEVEEIRFTVPDRDRPDPAVEFRTPYGWVPLRRLSHGYQTLIAWMVDFASRMVDRYPDSSDPLAEPAVVLVDEIDLHLHPTWQRKLIGYLTERFPNTQFIATAHSPLIVQAASDANIALLRREGDHVVIDNDVEEIKNWRVDQILTSDLFGLESARPPQLDGLMKRRKELLTRPKLSKAAQKELAEIEAKIGDLPTGETHEHIDLMKRIDSTLKQLRDRQGEGA